MIGRRTPIAVVTRSRIELLETSRHRVAQIVRANISVIAIERRSAHALPIDAFIRRRACIRVIARIRVVRMHAAAAGDARIVRAHVVVVAIIGRSADTDAIRTRIHDRTWIAVFAGTSVHDFGRLHRRVIDGIRVRRQARNRRRMRHHARQDAHVRT